MKIAPSRIPPAIAAPQTYNKGLDDVKESRRGYVMRILAVGIILIAQSLLVAAAAAQADTTDQTATVTCDFPSGRRKGSVPFLRICASRIVSLCANEIGVGIKSSFSPHA